MNPRRVILRSLFALALPLGCKNEPHDQVPLDRVCRKVAALSGSQFTPHQEDGCVAEMGSLGPQTQACMIKCVDELKPPSDLEGCKTLCGTDGNVQALRRAYQEARRTCLDACTDGGGRECGQACGPESL